MGHLLEVKDFSRYDWATPIMRSDTGLTPEEFAEINVELNKRYVLYRPHWLIRGLFSPYKHKRGLYWWFFRTTIKMIFLQIKDLLMGNKGMEGVTGFMRLRKPDWYDA